jgi:hypothetical protein
MTNAQRNFKAALDSGAVQAWVEGKQIQRLCADGHWSDFPDRHCVPNFHIGKWRVKPEPEPLLERWDVVRGRKVIGSFETCEGALGDIAIRHESSNLRIVHMREVREANCP